MDPPPSRARYCRPTSVTMEAKKVNFLKKAGFFVDSAELKGNMRPANITEIRSPGRRCIKQPFDTARVIARAR